MDSNDLFSLLDNETRPAKTKSKKRKWREIEAIKDNFRLKKELAEFDIDFDYELETAER